jgi:hypothetical protein
MEYGGWSEAIGVTRDVEICTLILARRGRKIGFIPSAAIPLRVQLGQYLLLKAMEV